MRDPDDKERSRSINAVRAGIPVADFEAALIWYAGLVGRPADERPMDSLAEWHFPETGVIQVIQDPNTLAMRLFALKWGVAGS